MKISLEYIWVGGNREFRSKIKIINTSKLVLDVEDIPLWNFDGSSTNQATGLDTEVILKPVKIVRSPFKLESLQSSLSCVCKSYLVLCETNNEDRENARKIFDSKSEEVPWFGLEQEYFMIWQNSSHDTNNQGPYYCGIGKGKDDVERMIALEHLNACLYADLEISGINAEVAHRQWEYQIGPCIGIDAADQLMLSRYILEIISEKYGVNILYHPKPFPNVNGSGCHVNFSTESMRQEGGIRVIEDAVRKLGKNHNEMISISGEHNILRLTGHHETSSMDDFSWGIGTRHTSVRIPNTVFNEGKGYFEDRRCAANINPYVVTSSLFKICCL